jgi:hypothetical protein
MNTLILTCQICPPHKLNYETDVPLVILPLGTHPVPPFNTNRTRLSRTARELEDREEQDRQTAHIVNLTVTGISNAGLVSLLWGCVRTGIERRTRAIQRGIWEMQPWEFRRLLERHPTSFMPRAFFDYNTEANRRGLTPTWHLDIQLFDLANYIAGVVLLAESPRKKLRNRRTKLATEAKKKAR